MSYDGTEIGRLSGEFPQLRVLVIEDSQDDAQLTVRELERAGFNLDWRRVETREQLVEALDEGGWELILCDYQTRTLTGTEALAMVRGRGLDTPFIVVSGTAGEETAVEMMRDGADDYFLKGSLRLLPGAVARELREAGHRRARREAEERLRLLTRALEASANAVVVADRDGAILWANPAFTSLTGYESEEVLGKNPRFLKSGHHPESFYEEMWNTILAGKTWHGELVNKRKNETLYSEEMTITPVTDDGGTVTHFIAVKQDISQRKAMEYRVRKSEERFRTMYENVTIGLYQTTPEGHILMANPALVHMLGYDSFEELASRNLEVDGFEPSYPRSRFLEKIQRDGEVHGLEAAWRRRDGTTIHVRESARAVRDGQGRILYFEGTVEDITEQKLAEKALRESEERYRDLVEHSHELMSTQTLDGTILSVNPAVEASLGLTAEEIVGRNIRELIVPRYRGRFEAYEQTIRERGEAAGLMRVRRPSGEERLWEYRNSLRTEHVPEPIVRGLARDITDEWRARKKVEESEERYRDLVEKAGVAIVVDDAEGRITYCNRRFIELFGYAEDEIQSLNIRDIIHPEDRENILDIHRAHLSGKSAPWSYRFRGIHRDGRVLHLAVDVTPLIRDGTIAGTRSYFHDVTEYELLQAELLQAQKMESVGRLAGGVAHDFNNILQAILAHADMAGSGPSGDPKVEEHLREIRRAGERAANLTRQLLAFSRREEIQTRTLDLNELTAGMLKMLRRLIGEDIEVVYEPGAGVPSIEGDPGHLEQVLLNLAVNARDAMPNGGRLVISTSSEPPRDKDGPPQVALRVADTGRGMDEATRQRIFEPFFTTKERGQGTGLGLATVYGIIRRHGGMIEVESEPGRGTTFTVLLPASAGTLPEENTTSAERPRGGTETILIAEDEPTVRRILADALRAAGYTVLEAEDGAQAVELFTADAERVQLALLDALMPHMDGPEAAERIRRIKPGLPVLFSSGYSGDALGAAHHIPPDAQIIQKPYSISDLLASIRRLLDGES